MTGDRKIFELAHQNLEIFSTELTQYPSGFTQMLAALDFSLGPSREIVIHGTLGKKGDAMVEHFNRNVSDNIAFGSKDTADMIRKSFAHALFQSIFQNPLDAITQLIHHMQS